jgi:uncharacterized protein
MKKTILISVVFYLFFSITGYAMDGNQRLAIIKALKLKGIVGENNKGYLEFRSGDTQALDVVNEENSVRSKVYEDIAKSSGVSVETVGSQRASQIAAGEVSGVWIQDIAGNWKKK